MIGTHYYLNYLPFHFEFALFAEHFQLFSGLFGWGGFGLRDLALRAQIQIFCLNDLKSFGFGFGQNPSWISKAQIHGFQMSCIARNLGNPPPRSVPLARASLTQSHSRPAFRHVSVSLTSPLSVSLTSPLSSLTSPF